MTPIATVFLVLSALIVWGGLIASGIFLGRRAEIAEYPPEDALMAEVEVPAVPGRDT